MPPAGFETAIPASERPLAYALDRAATGSAYFRSISGKRKAAQNRVAFKNISSFCVSRRVDSNNTDVYD
jgi:alkylhydroperoxidase family enzyme